MSDHESAEDAIRSILNRVWNEYGNEEYRRVMREALLCCPHCGHQHAKHGWLRCAVCKRSPVTEEPTP